MTRVLEIIEAVAAAKEPLSPTALAERLDLSQASFEGRVPWQEAWYTLMLEDGDTGDIDGVGSVKATVGLKRPFFSFRVVNNTVQSPSLGVKLDHQTLVL
ncbi:arginine N-succinyltransferase, partial [Klebsiella pneumoniae]|nr:arginine N-succinyltransferase [Klebsiella pneumoniae]